MIEYWGLSFLAFVAGYLFAVIVMAFKMGRRDEGISKAISDNRELQALIMAHREEFRSYLAKDKK